MKTPARQITAAFATAVLLAASGTSLAAETGATSATPAASTAAPTAPEILKESPPNGTLRQGEVAYVDDGSCRRGMVRKITGGNQKTGVARQVECIKRPSLP